MIKINDKIFNSILFIGDPHLTSTPISRRDDPVHISETILNKMYQIAKITHEYKSYPVFLGDLFDNDKEKNISLLTNTIRVFKCFYYKPITIIGNHEKTEAKLNDNNMTTTLIESGYLDYFDDNNVTVQIKVNNEQIEMGGTNYGSKIPTKVLKKSKKTDKLIWITHHDLIFRNFYPNAIPLHHIDGVDLAVNGHIHNTQPQTQLKTTTWCCPGNILRQSIDMEEHVPSVWLWTPENHNESFDKLIQIPLEYKKDIFKKVHIIEANEKNDFSIKHNESDTLKFITMAQVAQDNLDSNKTSDKDLVKQYMNNLSEIHNLPLKIKNELENMLEKINL